MTTALPLADTRDMIGLHRVIRNALGSSADLIGGVADGDRERSELVGSYYDSIFRLLHAHHEGEDELMTPRLVQRCTDSEAEQVQRIAAMHDDVTADLASAEATVEAWRGSAAAGNRDAAVQAVSTLNSTAVGHFDQEEAVVLPIAARYINVAEWGELPGHAMRTFTGDKLWLIIGLAQEQMPPSAIANMEANMPAPVLAMWNSTGRGLFADFVGRLRA